MAEITEQNDHPERTVEHRYYPRMQVSLKVDIFKNDHHIGSTITKDVSLGGMKIQSDGLSTSLSGVVLLQLSIQGEQFLVSGFVVHSSRKTSGIMFYGMSRDATRAYFNFLSQLEMPLRMAFRQSYKRSDQP
ncbi:MAG: PilZ domain-containing protein [Candidatus Thiodiazotropha sp. DIVDIV]